MQAGSDEDDLCLSLAQKEAAIPQRCLYVGHRLLVLVAFLTFLSACTADPGDPCSRSQAALTLLCMSPSNTKSAPEVTPVGPELVEKRVMHYVGLVLEKQYSQAYDILGADVRAQEPFDDFVVNREYTLYTGCWTIGQVFVGQADDQTWHVGVEMTQVVCDDDSPVAYFYWHFRLQVQGELVIISIGLYPTAPGN